MSRGIVLPGSSAEWGFKGKNYLFTIGIDKYVHWKPLHNAVKDIRDISRLLTERYQFDPENVFTLTDADATENNIRQKLLEVRRTITSDDNLIVIYSGHGHYDPEIDEGYWVPANAGKNETSDYISNSDVLKWIRSMKTHHTLVLVDACFSGSLVSQSRSEVKSEKFPSARIFASGRKELVDDGSPGTNSPFAKAILTRLSYNTERVLRASELIHAVTKTVESESGQAPVEGRIKDAGDDGGEFVFHLKISEEEIWTSVIAENTAAGFERYLNFCPEGKYALEARTKFSLLTESADWKRAVETGSVKSLLAYMEAHPTGAHYEDALTKLEEIEENEAWQIAKNRNTLSAYSAFLRKYRDGRYAVEAQKSLDSLKQVMHSHEKADDKTVAADLEENPVEKVVEKPIEKPIERPFVPPEQKGKENHPVHQTDPRFHQREYQNQNESYNNAAAFVSNLTVGNWRVYDQVINSVSMARSGQLVPASWMFYPNGNLSGVVGGQILNGFWNLTGNILTMRTIYLLYGPITGWDANTFVWQVTQEDQYGNRIYFTNYFSR